MITFGPWTTWASNALATARLKPAGSLAEKSPVTGSRASASSRITTRVSLYRAKASTACCRLSPLKAILPSRQASARDTTPGGKGWGIPAARPGLSNVIRVFEGREQGGPGGWAVRAATRNRDTDCRGEDVAVLV